MEGGKKKVTDTKSYALGIIMPGDFPCELYEKVRSQVTRDGNQYKSLNKLFGVGWNGVGYCYRAMDEYHQEFAESFNKKPSHELLFYQNKSLFGFLTTAVSTIECFFFSLHFIGSIENPLGFPFEDPKLFKRLYPKEVTEEYLRYFERHVLSNKMKECVESSEYHMLNDMRDVLSHRGTFPRNYFMGGDEDGTVTIASNPKDIPDKWKNDIQFNKNTTLLYRQWLSRTINELLECSDIFSDKFKKVG
jgi:hypothetical protein